MGAPVDGEHLEDQVLPKRSGLEVLQVSKQRWPWISVIIVTGFVFWFVPNTRVRFRDVWVGALVTGVLWRIGQNIPR